MNSDERFKREHPLEWMEAKLHETNDPDTLRQYALVLAGALDLFMREMATKDHSPGVQYPVIKSEDIALKRVLFRPRS
jgi:hypothetical protein